MVELELYLYVRVCKSARVCVWFSLLYGRYHVFILDRSYDKTSGS